MTNFNISLVENLNQTGAGAFCLKEAGRANLEEGLKAAGYSGVQDERLSGLEASVQVIQLSHTGSALYNVCAPILGILSLKDVSLILNSARTFSSTRQPSSSLMISVSTGRVSVLRRLVTSRSTHQIPALERLHLQAQVLRLC